MPDCVLVGLLFQSEMKLWKLLNIQISVQLASFIRTNAFFTCFVKCEIGYHLANGYLLLRVTGEQSF